VTRAPFDLVVFDCDGVLVDSERLSIRVDRVYLERLGWPMGDAEIIERFVGRSDADMRAEIEAHLGGPIPADIEDEFARLYRATFDAELTAVDGIVEALDAIVARGLRTCVASSGSHEKIRRSLELTGLSGYFGERIFSATEVTNGKPAPDLFLHAAATLGAEPGRCAVVEDSVHGVRAALDAGMAAFAYTGGVTPARALAAAGDGVVTFDDMRALPALVAGTASG
jgi:HAD superfamily hydrolase (TIGR01509 family)